jgi:uncharacterized protein (TIGR02391 family)
MPTPGVFVPDNEADLLALPIDELGVQLLFFLAAAQWAGESSWLNSHNIVLNTQWGLLGLTPGPRFVRAVAEGWAWLIARGLLAPRPGAGDNDYFITRRGESLAKDREPLTRLRAEQRLDVDLHPRLHHRIRNQFLLGEFELAAFAALREVEIRVRDMSGASESDIGVKLMQWAFGDEGPLRQTGMDEGEQKAMMALFWGAIGVFKNPPSHRQVDFGDPTLAAEIVLLADLLLRMLDRVEPSSKHRTAPRRREKP